MHSFTFHSIHAGLRVKHLEHHDTKILIFGKARLFRVFANQVTFTLGNQSTGIYVLVAIHFITISHTVFNKNLKYELFKQYKVTFSHAFS